MISSFFTIFLLVQCLNLISTDTTDEVVTEIESGVRIIGYRTQTLTNRSLLAFRGIPYAEPPEGELRFRRPVPKRWTTDTFNATNFGPQCIQIDYFFVSYPKVTGQEDCLVLNVFTHNTSKPLRNVIVFIHGGGFVLGNGGQFGPKRLLDHDVVLVTINYRLNLFGFLSTLDEECPGNFGLFDQTEALKWIQRNIEAFGGDPNKVTIIGQSAGAASVFFHLLSPVSKGLFHRAIAHSGNVLCPWSEQKDPLKWTNLLAEKAGCFDTNTTEMMQRLRKASIETIYAASKTLRRKINLMEFLPVTDGHFVSESPEKLFREGKISNRVPLLIGTVKDEGLAFSPYVYLKTPRLSNEMIANSAAMAFNLEPRCVTNETIELIKNKYFKDIKSETNLQEAITKVISDGLMHACFYETIRVLADSGAKPFVFINDYVKPHTLAKFYTKQRGIAHTEDLFFLFDNKVLFPLDNKKPNDKTENKFLEIWLSFAENGYPVEVSPNGTSSIWQPAQPDHISVNHLNEELSVEYYNPQLDSRLDFWLQKIPAVQSADKCK